MYTRTAALNRAGTHKNAHIHTLPVAVPSVFKTRMAYSEETDEDFKLPLRPWLEKQINSKKYRGLEWEQFDGDKKLFRLPWIKKNLPDWQEYYKIFRAWAQHRGRGEEDAKLDDSKLKSNFRCALNKSVDFEEVTSMSQLHKQTGNYKVYRILTPKEVRERKKKRSKVQTKQEHNFDSEDYKTIDKKSLEQLDSFEPSAPNSMDSCDTSMPMSAFLNQPIQTCPDSLDASQFFTSNAPITVRPPEMDDFSSTLAISPAQQQHAVPPIWAPLDVEMEDEPVVVKSSVKETSQPASENECMSPKSIILEQLKNSGIEKERLCQCQIIIRYNGEKVLDKEVMDLDKGYRIFYGNQEEQVRLLQLRNTTDEKLSDFKLKRIQLPELKQRSHTMSAILDKTDLGVILSYDPQTLQIYAKRLCQSQIFFFNPHDHSRAATPKKLEREETVMLFSYEKYFVEYMQQCVGTQDLTPLEADIVLTVGIKPRSRMSLEIMKGLKIEIIPYALKVFMQSNKDHPTSMSLYFSNPTSMENLLRQIHQNSASGNDLLG